MGFAPGESRGGLPEVHVDSEGVVRRVSSKPVPVRYIVRSRLVLRTPQALYRARLHTPDPLGQNLWMGADLYRHPLELTIVHDWEFDDRWPRRSVETVAYTSIPSAANDYVGQNYPGWCDEGSRR